MATRREIAAAFARGESARGASALENTGRAIYSYGGHFPIAVHMPDGSVLLTELPSPSMTTSHHISAVRGALAMAGYAPTGETREHAERYAKTPYGASLLVADTWSVWRKPS